MKLEEVKAAWRERLQSPDNFTLEKVRTRLDQHERRCFELWIELDQGKFYAYPRRRQNAVETSVELVLSPDEVKALTTFIEGLGISVHEPIAVYINWRGVTQLRDGTLFKTGSRQLPEQLLPLAQALLAVVPTA